tara:strand:- start:363 stop:485 length:123 start_codon:yes stop_codon:yes gene_type:complete
MAYSQTVVLAGGIAHVPILIIALKYIEKGFANRMKAIKEN